MTEILDIIKNRQLTYEQRVLELARYAENQLDVLNISDKCQDLRDEGIICDLFEGNAPYRPRYIVVDFEKFVKNGSEFLELTPPENLDDLLNKLLILYKHIPSISSFPVYIGNLDYLIEPFIKDEKKDYEKIKRFLMHIDRTITDSFCHANLGPKDTKAASLILKAQRELEVSVPNITLKYNTESTDKELFQDSLKTALKTAKPSIANDKMFRKDFDGDYAIASCYNGLRIGGGSFTLVRLVLKKLADKTDDYQVFLNELLPEAVNQMLDYMDERIKFLIEETSFFETNFLAKEKLIDKNNFSAMFGLVGLGNVVNKYSDYKFGHDEIADKMGVEIIENINNLVKNHSNKYCKGSNNKFLLHAQVGLDTDDNIAPGCRVPIGDEPDIVTHLNQLPKFHSFFQSGIGDIFPFEETYKDNIKAVSDIIDGAIKKGSRYLSIYSSDSDVVRITGYLVKRSEIEKLRNGEPVLRNTAQLGKGAVDNQHVLDRKTKK
ncbi:MAG: YjjI family glycine radical enzyme [Bacillota bacterium]